MEWNLVFCVVIWFQCGMENKEACSDRVSVCNPLRDLRPAGSLTWSYIRLVLDSQTSHIIKRLLVGPTIYSEPGKSVLILAGKWLCNIQKTPLGRSMSGLQNLYSTAVVNLFFPPSNAVLSLITPLNRCWKVTNFQLGMWVQRAAIIYMFCHFFCSLCLFKGTVRNI